MVVLLFLIAVVPTIVYVGLLWWLDKYEKEPWGLFVAAFLYGCVPAVIFSLGVEWAVGGSESTSMGLVAPIVEEVAKGLAVLLIFLIWRREFDGVVDGIIYGAVVGFGFAMIENFLYGLSYGPGVLLLRAVPFGLNHAFFTAFTGAGLGLARLSRQRWLWVLLFPLALAMAITFHAIHNNAVGQGGCAGLGVALISNGGGVLVILLVAILSWRQERRWIQQELGEEVTTGLMAPADHQALLSLSRRVGARMWTWRHYGWRAFRLLGRYFNLAVELAFRKHHIRAGTADTGWLKDVDTLRQRVRETRDAILTLERPT